MFLLPYVLSVLAILILRPLNNFLLYGSFSSALREAAYTLLGLLYATTKNISFGEFYIPYFGALWFLVALVGGWFILNLILNYSEGWKRHLLVFLAGIIGYYGNSLAEKLAIPAPFCIFYMFVFVPMLYIGYLSREHKWLEKKLSPAALALIAVSLAGFVWNYKVPFSFLQDTQHPLGVFTDYAAGGVAFGFVYLMTHINRRETRITNFLEWIGNNSIRIYCIHAVELIGIPWDILRWLMPNTSGPHSFFVILVLRSCCIAIGLLVITHSKERGGFSRLKEQLSRKKAVKAQ